MSLRVCKECVSFRPGGSRTEQVQSSPKLRVSKTSLSLSKCAITGDAVRAIDSACTSFREA